MWYLKTDAPNSALVAICFESTLLYMATRGLSSIIFLLIGLSGCSQMRLQQTNYWANVHNSKHVCSCIPSHYT